MKFAVRDVVSGYSGDGLIVGLDYLSGLFHRFYDSMVLRAFRKG